MTVIDHITASEKKELNGPNMFNGYHQRAKWQSPTEGKQTGKGRPRRKQHPQQKGWHGRYYPALRKGSRCAAYGLGYVDDEGEDGNDDECDKGTGIYQFGRVNPLDRLPVHCTGDFLPLPSEVLDTAIRSI